MNALASSILTTPSFSIAPTGRRGVSADLLRSLQRLRGAAALSP
jgi:hypothetical protein